jgi:hypothetical protein
MTSKFTSEADAGVALCGDGWTGRNQRHFMGIPALYLTPDFELRRITIDFLESGKKGDDV